MNDDLEPDDEHEELPGRSVQSPTSAPSASAKRRLTEALVERGFQPHLAKVLTRAVESPKAVLDQLKAPAEMGIHGGAIEYVVTRVRNGTVLPIPTNPRVSHRVRYPAGGTSGGPGIEPLEVEGAPGGQPALIIGTADEASLRRDMAEVTAQVQAMNDLGPSVRSQGVLLPVTVVACEFDFRDGRAPVQIACTVDGSSRLVAAMSTWKLDADEIVFDLASDRALERRTDAVRALFERDSEDLAEDDRAAMRNQFLPANLILGFKTDEEGLTFPDVLDSYLGLLHVEPPKEWGDAAEQDARAEAVLDELERAGKVTPAARRYLAGLMTPAEAMAEGFDPTLDGRAASAIYELDRRANARAANRALRRLGMNNPDRGARLGIAAELAIRPYRLLMNDAQRRNPRQALPTAMVRLRPDTNVWTPTTRDIDAIRDAALDEIADGAPGASVRELAVRGAFWLTRFSALQRSSRTDQRFADQLLEDLMRTVQGVHQLYQAVVDGRDGEPLRRVRVSGEIMTSESGEALLVEDRRLRETFPAGVEPEVAPEGPDVPPQPHEVLLVRLYSIRDDVLSVQNKVEALEEVEDDDGNALAPAVGFSQDQVELTVEALDKVRTRMVQLGAIWQVTGGASG